MCLDNITKRHDKPVARERWVWKMFRHDTGRLYCLIRGMFSSPVRRGRWLKAKKAPINMGDGQTYAAGFHAVLTKADAIRYRGGKCECCTAVRVKVRGVRLEGRQSGVACIVADEMFIPKATSK